MSVLFKVLFILQNFIRKSFVSFRCWHSPPLDQHQISKSAVRVCTHTHARAFNPIYFFSKRFLSSTFKNNITSSTCSIIFNNSKQEQSSPANNSQSLEMKRNQMKKNQKPKTMCRKVRSIFRYMFKSI